MYIRPISKRQNHCVCVCVCVSMTMCLLMCVLACARVRACACLLACTSVMLTEHRSSKDGNVAADAVTNAILPLYEMNLSMYKCTHWVTPSVMLRMLHQQLNRHFKKMS